MGVTFSRWKWQFLHGHALKTGSIVNIQKFPIGYICNKSDHEKFFNNFFFKLCYSDINFLVLLRIPVTQKQ